MSEAPPLSYAVFVSSDFTGIKTQLYGVSLVNTLQLTQNKRFWSVACAFGFCVSESLYLYFQETRLNCIRIARKGEFTRYLQSYPGLASYPCSSRGSRAKGTDTTMGA